jgi:hypothetical protein
MFCIEGPVWAGWRTGHQKASHVRRARAISNLVVPNLGLVLSSPSRHGPNPFERRWKAAIFLGSIRPFIHTVSLCPH